MNFFEAYVEAKAGKLITIEGVDSWYLKLGNSTASPGKLSFIVYDKSGAFNDKIDISMMTHWMECDWEIYEEPKKSKGLWEKSKEASSGILLQLNTFILNSTASVGRPIYFDSPNIAEEWHRALNTFMRLKDHPLAVKPIHNINQFYITVYNPASSEYLLSIDYNIRITFKASVLSPCFSTREDTKQAIIDIGTENLLYMFKTFQGIYK